MTADTFTIGPAMIGGAAKPYIIAEIGHNHLRSLDLAKAMVRQAWFCGADAVKFQHRNRVPLSFLLACRDEARKVPIEFLCTAYEVGTLNEIDPYVRAHKVGSAECIDLGYVSAVAARGKPVILSTGAATVEMLMPSLRVLEQADVPYALLQCTSVYPCPPQLVRLGALRYDLALAGAPAGYSDHTGDVIAPIMALALGAAIVEVHFTLSEALPGIDQCVSHDPEALGLICRAAEQRHGLLRPGKEFFPEEREKIDKFRRTQP